MQSILVMKRWAAIFLLATLCAARGFAQDAGTLRRAALYEPLVIDAGARYGVDPRLLWTIAFLETRFRPDLVSRVGARGIMQFMPATAARFHLDDPHDAAASIDAAARYLRELQTMFGHRLDLILAAYNAGEGTVTAFKDGRRLPLSDGRVINPRGIKTGGMPPYRETYTYVIDGVALYSRLAGRRELMSTPRAAKYQRLEAPAVPQEPKESMPDEITRLKQGSIYVVTSAAANERSLDSALPVAERPPQKPTTRSIYSRR